jgi:alpha-beta hydrolase superfamily lysophospholipase
MSGLELNVEPNFNLKLHLFGHSLGCVVARLFALEVRRALCLPLSACAVTH